MGGVTYSHGISMDGSAQVIYPLGGVVNTFTGLFGPEDRIANNGQTNRLTIYGDGTQLWQSSQLTNSMPATNFNVNVTGVMMLTLILTSSGGPTTAYRACDIANGQFIVNGPAQTIYRAVKTVEGLQSLNTVLTDDPELQVYLDGPATYLLEGQLIYQTPSSATNNPGFKALSVFGGTYNPAMSSGMNMAMSYYAVAGSTSQLLIISYPDNGGNNNWYPWGSGVATGYGIAAQAGGYNVKGVYRVSAPGLFKVQWCQNTSGFGPTHLCAGSYVSFTRLQ
jgi:hypothetical protein